MALATLAAMPLGLVPAILAGQRAPLLLGEFLPECTASLTACWHLMMGDGLATVATQLPKYLPALELLTQQPLATHNLNLPLREERGSHETTMHLGWLSRCGTTGQASHKASPWLQTRDAHSCIQIGSAETRSVIQWVKLHGLGQFDNFEIRFVRRTPSFTDIMIDGDRNHKGKTPRDSERQMRLQPMSVHSIQHHGLILQFRE
jgi:hypothetical protein